MLWDLLRERRRAHVAGIVAAGRNRSLQLVLWALWTLAVAAVGYFTWHADTLGLVIHCAVAGVIGLVVLTIVEMHLQPERFRE